MWKLSRRGGKTPRATGAAVAALVLFGGLTLPAAVTFACDDDYRSPVGYVPYPQQGPTVVVVDPHDHESRYDRRRERAERRYWHWRAREHRHHGHDRDWR